MIIVGGTNGSRSAASGGLTFGDASSSCHGATCPLGAAVCGLAQEGLG